MKEDYTSIIGISSLAGLIASLCCVTPVVLVLFGITSVSFASALDYQLDSNYEAAFVLLGMATLFLGIWVYYKKNRLFLSDNVGKTRLINYLIIGMVFFLVAYLIIHNIIAFSLEERLGIWGGENVYFGYKP